MPFGMKNVPPTFQRLINSIIDSLEGCEGYIDDVIIYSNTWEQHLKQLYAFFERLSVAHLTVNILKSYG